MSFGPGYITKTPPPPLLDQYDGAAAAYSLRKLREGYSGDAIRVRRSSDNSEKDFAPSEVGDGSVSSFVGNSEGYIVHEDDQQTANVIEATQSTQAAQPKIADSSGNILNPGSKNKPAPEFDNGRYLTLGSAPSGDLKTLIGWVYLKSNVVKDDSNSRVLLAPTSGTVPLVLFGDATDNLTNETISIISEQNEDEGITEPISSGWHHIGLRWTGSEYEFLIDGTAYMPSAGGPGSGLLSMGGADIGYRPASSDLPLEGHIHTLALFDTALSVSDIQDHYDRTK